MLAYVLALVIGIGSLGIYIAAFFFPEVHRKQDFFWSAVGLFYALVLWVCAGRITGGVLLGQIASVALLGWFGWETLTLRRALASPDEQTPIASQDELQAKLKNISPVASIGGLQQRVTAMFRKGKSEAKTPEKPAATKVSSSPEVTVIDATTTEKAPASVEVKDTTTTVTPSASEEAPTLDVTIVEEEVIEVTDEPDAEVVTLVGFAEVTEQEVAGEAEMSESPELIRPNPPDPELVKEAIASTPENAPEASQPTLPIEEVAPRAEQPGLGGPEDRKTDAEPENPSKQT